MIVWTKSTEILDVERPVTEEERQAARDRVVEGLAGLEETKRLKQALLADVDRRELAFQRMVAENMKQAARQVEIRAVAHRVGYDTVSGEVVLGNGDTGEQVLTVRPMTDSDWEWVRTHERHD